MLLSDYLSKDIITYIFGIYLDYIHTVYILKEIDPEINIIRKHHLSTTIVCGDKSKVITTNLDNSIIFTVIEYNETKSKAYVFHIYSKGILMRDIAKTYDLNKKLISFASIENEYIEHKSVDDEQDIAISYGSTIRDKTNGKFKFTGKKYFFYQNTGNMKIEQNSINGNIVGISYFYSPTGKKIMVFYKDNRIIRKESYDSEGKYSKIEYGDYIIEYSYKNINSYICDICIKINNILKYILQNKRNGDHELVIFPDDDTLLCSCDFLDQVITMWTNYEKIIDKYKN